MLPSPGPVVGVDDEAAIRLDRAADVKRRVGRGAGIEPQLAHQRVQPDSRHMRADADSERAVLVVRAHRDHRMLEPRIADARHGQQQLTDKIAGAFHLHGLTRLSRRVHADVGITAFARGRSGRRSALGGAPSAGLGQPVPAARAA